MRLQILTPLAVIVDAPDILALRAEDDSGSFGVLRHHADFLTTLAVCVVDWRDAAGRSHYCAVRRGVLSVAAGDVWIATREAVPGEDIGELEQRVLARFRDELDAERGERVESTRLQIDAIRQIMRHLRPSALRGGEPP